MPFLMQESLWWWQHSGSYSPPPYLTHWHLGPHRHLSGDNSALNTSNQNNAASTENRAPGPISAAVSPPSLKRNRFWHPCACAGPRRTCSVFWDRYLWHPSRRVPTQNEWSSLASALHSRRLSETTAKSWNNGSPASTGLADGCCVSTVWRHPYRHGGVSGRDLASKRNDGQFDSLGRQEVVFRLWQFYYVFWLMPSDSFIMSSDLCLLTYATRIYRPIRSFHGGPPIVDNRRLP